MVSTCMKLRFGTIAPARERGLKSAFAVGTNGRGNRSREGAWIEIITDIQRDDYIASLPRGSVD